MPKDPKNSNNRKNQPKDRLLELKKGSESELEAINKNYAKASLANYALRQISKHSPSDINIVFTDKPAIKSMLSQIGDIDEIYTKMTRMMGDAKLPEYLTSFQKKMDEVEKLLTEFTEHFYTLNIGNGKSIENWKKEKAKTEADEAKDEKKVKEITSIAKETTKKETVKKKQ